MRIAVDAMGGDHAPDEIVRGALLYRAEGGVADIVLVGREEAVRAALGTTPRPGITVVDARDVVEMHEHPSSELRRRSGTSIGVATELVKRGGADAVVSAGNTGATMASAVLILKRIPGIVAALPIELLAYFSGIRDQVSGISKAMPTRSARRY